jgi:hypothetical protein
LKDDPIQDYFFSFRTKITIKSYKGGHCEKIFRTKNTLPVIVDNKAGKSPDNRLA